MTGAQQELRIPGELLSSEVDLVPARGEPVRAADLKVDRKISYAYAFAVELATQLADHVW